MNRTKDYFLGEEVGFHYTDKDGFIVFVRTKTIDYVSVPRSSPVIDKVENKK
jgi:hypothetical protein